MSHSATAAVLWEFDGARAHKVELWVPRQRNIRSELVEVHRCTRLDRADRTTLGRQFGSRRPVRTLIDMAGRLDDHRLFTVLEDLIRRDLIRPDRLAARLDALEDVRATRWRPARGAAGRSRRRETDGVGARDARLAVDPSGRGAAPSSPALARRRWRSVSPRLRMARRQGRSGVRRVCLSRRPFVSGTTRKRGWPSSQPWAGECSPSPGTRPVDSPSA